MNPMAIIALINAALLLVEKIPAALAHLKQSQELTPEQAALLDAKIEEFARNAQAHLGS